MVLVVGYKKERIMSYFGDGKAIGANIQYAVQDRQLGTAHALRVAKGAVEGDFLKRDGATTVFVEVKRRRDAALGTPAEAVTRTKRARVVRAARRDVVAIRDDSAAVEWLRGAFDASR